RPVHVDVGAGEVEVRFAELGARARLEYLPDDVVRRAREAGDRDLLADVDVVDVRDYGRARSALVGLDANRDGERPGTVPGHRQRVEGLGIAAGERCRGHGGGDAAMLFHLKIARRDARRVVARITRE